MNLEMTVDMPLLSKSTQTLLDETEYLKKRLNDLISSVAELDSCWSGSAAAAFKNSMEEDISCLKEFTSILSRAAEDYQFAIKTYTDCDSKASQIIEAISI